MNTTLKDRTDFFEEIGPEVAGQMSEALQSLIAEKIKVEFSSVQTFEQDTLSVDVGEKCFGSYVNFQSPGDNLEGIIAAIFPLSSTKTLIELLLKRYHRDKETIDHKMKLSAFKEAVNILVLTYITEVANALKVKLKMSVPRFVSFHNIEFMKPTILRDYSNLEGLVSVGQFRIKGGGRVSNIKGRFIIVF